MNKLLNKTGVIGARAMGIEEATRLRAQTTMGPAVTVPRNQDKVVQHAAGEFLIRAGAIAAGVFALLCIAAAVGVLVHAKWDLNTIPHGSVMQLLGLWPIYLPLALCLFGLYVSYVGFKMRDPELAGTFIEGARDIGKAVKRSKGAGG